MRQALAGLRSALRRVLGRAPAHPAPDCLVVGLGNPGPRYADTRHNIGFEIVRAFASRHGLALDEERHRGRFGQGAVGDRCVALLLPQTFMNASGECVAPLLAELPGLDAARDVIVVYDDLDLPIGRLRVRRGGGAGGHRGVASLVAALGRKDFPRLRFGIGRPPEGVSVVDHVLAPFDDGDRARLTGRVETAVDALDGFVAHGIEATMDRFNAASSQGEAD